MPKAGLIHDYDLMANAEQSSVGVTCAVCDTLGTSFQWSDYSGEGMCTTCGCPYQLKWGTDEQKTDGKYPYLRLREDFLPVAREYWNERQVFVHYGMSMSRRDGLAELDSWIKEHHPELVTKD